ncbi:MAG: transcriptional regulator Spx [Erysipelotrichaceae bacterium]|nr:transcriptional regulator Spx [Erysipelotrichaceae bacterium]
MVVIYTSNGCASCRKAKKFLKDNDINFIEKNIFNTLLNPDEIKYLLKRSENGTEDIISKRSKIVQESGVNVDELPINELCDFIVKNPSVLKRPIIISENNLQIGYDEEEISLFKAIRNAVKCDNNCPHYEICGSNLEA